MEKHKLYNNVFRITTENTQMKQSGTLVMIIDYVSTDSKQSTDHEITDTTRDTLQFGIVANAITENRMFSQSHTLSTRSVMLDNNIINF